MANEEQVWRLRTDVGSWNAWRAKSPKEKINLRGADLMGAHLREADLREADLREADFRGALLMGADLSKANLKEAKLRRADLSGADLHGASLSEADLCSAKLNADLRGADLRRADLSEADLNGASLSEADLSGADLSGINLNKAKLRGVRLIGANLSEADLRVANLITAKLDEANLTDAHLWESQRADWSIRNVICASAYWDREGKVQTLYQSGEFERLYGSHTKIVLHYEGGMSPIEVATLPALIQQLEATHPGCTLRLESVQTAAGGATVTLVLEESAGRTSGETEALKKALETTSQQLVLSQRQVIKERIKREQIQMKLNMAYEDVFPRLKGDVVRKKVTNNYHAPIQGNAVGEISGKHAQVSATANDLASIQAPIREMLTPGAEPRGTGKQPQSLRRGAKSSKGK